jgi:DNA-binding NtrC family response regulator
MNRGARILVVDDREAEGDELRYLLEGEGYAVDQALCGAEALSKIGQERFDLVLTEIPVPDMDGSELIRDIREADHDTVEIVMGDHLPLEAAIEAWRCDVSGYVSRPLDDLDGVLAAVADGLADRKRKLVPPGTESQ